MILKLKLPKYVGVNKERFHEILDTITEAKKDRLKTNVDRREITLDNAESLLKDIARGKINGSKFKKEYNNIADDVYAILQKPMLARNKKKWYKFYHCLKKFQSFGIKITNYRYV